MTSRIDIKGMPGFRFMPTNEELIEHFLKLKLLGYDDQVSASIAEIDICKYEPWQLPPFAATESGNDTWYFFTRPDYKFAKSRRTNRKTIGGYWKATGKERKVLGKNNNEIATKRSLVFYEGRAPNGVKTNWIIHEYHSSITYSMERFRALSFEEKPDDDDVNLEEGESQPSQKANPKESNLLAQSHGEFQSQCGFSDEQDLECPSAQELEMYMWKEGPSSSSSSSSSCVKFYTDCSSNEDYMYKLEMMSDDHSDYSGTDSEGKLTDFSNSLFV